VIELAQTFSLGAGELESLCLMANVPQAILLTDDAAARLVAEKLGYEVHGTIGVVVRSLAGTEDEAESTQPAAINSAAKLTSCCRGTTGIRHRRSSSGVMTYDAPPEWPAAPSPFTGR
jgi:acetylornithine deacetylase/succinyl-diaminopimelate desuccinylase-like protein